MSGGSMDRLYLKIEDAEFKPENDTPLRTAFRVHLAKVAATLKAIEWNDSGDGDPDEDALIRACLGWPAKPGDEPALAELSKGLIERDREARLTVLVGSLEAAQAEADDISKDVPWESEDVQFAIDDLIYDHIGTSKQCSTINNGGFAVQLEALTGRHGLDETERMVKEALEKFR